MHSRKERSRQHKTHVSVFVLLSLFVLFFSSFYLTLIRRRSIAPMFSDFFYCVLHALNPTAPHKFTFLFLHLESLSIEPVVTAKTLARIWPITIWHAQAVLCPKNPFHWIRATEVWRLVHVDQIVIGRIIAARIGAY